MSTHSYWLIKTGGRVIGPLTTNEVGEAIRQNEVLPLDEIATSFGRWHYVRDERAFASIINELRSRKTSENTWTETVSDTATDITERISAFGSSDKLTQNIEEQLKERKSYARRSEEEKSSFAKLENSIQSVKPSNLAMWVGIAIILIGISYSVFVSKPHSDSNMSPEQLLKKAKLAWLSDDLSGASDSYQKAFRSNPNNYLIFSEYLLFLATEHRGSEVTSALNTVKMDGWSPEQALKSQNLVMSLLLQGEAYSKAKEVLELAKALLKTMSTEDFETTMNEGVLALAEGRIEDAEKLFTHAKSIKSSDPVVDMYIAEANILKSKALNSPQGFLSAKATLDGVISSSQEWKARASMLKLHILQELKESEAYEPVAAAILQTDPHSPKEYIRETSVDITRLGWNKVVKYLKSSAIAGKTSPKVWAALGYSLFLSGDKEEGRKYIEEAYSKLPEDNDIRSVMALVQWSIDRKEEAETMLQLVNAKPNELSKILAAQFCIEKRAEKTDIKCTDEAWRAVLEFDANSVSALSGLAWFNIEASQYTNAEKYIQQGFDQESNSKSLLKANLVLKGLSENK